VRRSDSWASVRVFDDGVNVSVLFLFKVPMFGDTLDDDVLRLSIRCNVRKL